MKSVIFQACSKVSCAGVASAPIVICLTTSDFLLSGKATLEGTLLNSTKSCSDTCGSDQYWRYSLQYDETLLVDPETPLTSDDIINFFCKDTCIVNWIEAEIAVDSVMATGTATGTIIADALQLTSKINNLTTVASGTGVIVPDVEIGQRVLVKNQGANALKVYPLNDGTNLFDALSAGASVSIAVGATGTFVRISATKWFTMESAAA